MDKYRPVCNVKNIIELVDYFGGIHEFSKFLEPVYGIDTENIDAEGLMQKREDIFR